MTKLPYPFGWTAGSQVRGNAPADYAWNVNFNNGNANYNNRNNDGFVRAVRGGECQGANAIELRELYDAWRAARRGKRPSANQLAFDVQWIDGLLELQAELEAGRWEPAPPTCFVAKLPKAREIHAPDFRDRV